MLGLEIGDLLLAAEEVLATDARELRYAVDIGAAESALTAPDAGFGDVERYPDVPTKAAILCSRIIRNHPFPDGNKRVARLLMLEVLEREGFEWTPPPRGDDEEVEVIIALAARQVSEEQFIRWVHRRVRWVSGGAVARVVEMMLGAVRNRLSA